MADHLDNLETAADFDRDFRSAKQEFKRNRNHQAKWANGKIPSPGCYWNLMTGELVGGSESQRAKFRPRGPFNDPWGKERHNMVKATRGNWDLPAGRVRTHMSAEEELGDASHSIIDLLPTARSGSGNVFDGVCNMPIYDGVSEASGPNRVPLDVFVKDNRGTEKLIEKEYEVLDTNGESLRGRKARRNLRKGGSPSGQLANDAEAHEDDGFELV